MRVHRLLPIGLIIVLTLLVYGKSLGNAFVRWDDSMLIYENPIVREISWKSLKAAFTTYDPELYIPLTFLSYQIDYAIGGMHPFGFHLTNLVLHTLNAVLVFFLLQLLLSGNNPPLPLKGEGRVRVAGRGTAFLVALLWAIHPLNTEAVVWASARKDVLSTFFFLGSLCTYLKWRDGCVTLRCEQSEPRRATQCHGSWLAGCHGEVLRSASGGATNHTPCLYLRMTRLFYILSIVAFLLGLLSKVMVLTQPVILLLLDCWQGRKITRNVLWEKAPYVVLSALLGAVGLFGKQSVLGASTLWEKFLMAPKSAVFYLEKLLWPQGLSVLYPYTGAVTIRSADFAVPLLLFLLFVSVAVWLWFRWRRASIGLWFFLITIVPTFLNFAKGGDMNLYFASDRYAYVPSIGIFLAVGYWLRNSLSHGERVRVRGVSISTVCILLILSLLSYRQSLLWRDTEPLLQNVLRLYGSSSHVAHNNMGNVYRLRGDLPRAIEEYKKALAIRPHSKTFSNLGATYRRLHQYPEAMEAYRKALELNPKNPEVQVGLGLVFLELGKLSDARKAFTEAIANDPRSEEAYVNLGAIAMREGKRDEAIAQYQRALEANPYFTQAHYNLAVALAAEGREEEAMEEYEAAVRGDPSFLAARINLGILYYDAGRRSEAQAQFRAVLRQDQKNAAAREALRQMGMEK